MFCKQILALIALCTIEVLTAGKNKNIPKWKKQACDVPQQNQYSHYKCDENGDLKCLPGWQGDVCDVPLCKKNCDPQQGYCKRPNECRCKLGFYGENCDRCIPLPGCQNGGCRQPFECHCHKGYEGIFCQEPICRQDCHPSHGYCESAGECRCRIGWTGKTCRDCQVLPGCMHGTCTKPLECRCLPGYRGFLCEQAICSADCSRQNGYCSKPGTCRCKVGWMGDDCTKCHPYPGCKNGDCKRPWECNCQRGWGGFLCDEQLNYCEMNAETCLNGGKCMSLTKDDGLFSCECPAGYRGERCDRTNMTITPINQVEIVTPLPMTQTHSEIPLLSERSTTAAAVKAVTAISTALSDTSPSSSSTTLATTTETYRIDDNET